MAEREAGIFTFTLTNNEMDFVDESWGVRKLSVYNGTSTTGTVTGKMKLGTLSSEPIDIAENESFAIEAIEGDTIKNITINAPSGCTLTIVAYL